MKEIKVGELMAFVDDDDYALVAARKWYLHRGARCRTSYAQASGGVLMHRMILNAPRGMKVDHKNSNGLDNRRENIRLCTSAQNSANSKARKHSTSGLRGVWQESDGSRLYWFGHVYFEGKRYRKMGKTKEECARWVEAKRREIHGEFAYDAAMDMVAA